MALSKIHNSYLYKYNHVASFVPLCQKYLKEIRKPSKYIRIDYSFHDFKSHFLNKNQTTIIMNESIL